MRLIKPSFSIWDQQEGLEGVYKQIERAGRVCYKSEDKITENSAKEFVDRMIKSGHGAMLEHGTIYMKFKTDISMSDNMKVWKEDWLDKLIGSPYSKNLVDEEDYVNLTTNLRVLIEISEQYPIYAKEALDFFLSLMCEPTEYHKRRVTVHFVCDRGVSHEFVRHRVFSFAQESTRYCNYSKDKFQGVTYIQPPWLDGDISNEDGSKFNDVYTDIYLHTLTTAENAYLDLLKQWDNKVPDKRFKSGYKNNPWTPQQARAVLPNSLKTELVMTGFVSDWEHFFKLRDAGSAHPQARELAHPLHMEFLRRNYLVDLYDEANPD
jgi:thymidylate synthase (FAD)